MNNEFHDYFSLLNLPEDNSIKINKVEVIDNFKHIYLSRSPSPVYCENCGCRMHSKGLYGRTVNHPIFQDGSQLILHVSQRRWKCTGCLAEVNESFPFLDKYKHSSTITPLLILQAMKDLNRSSVSIADQFNISDSTVHNVFSQYVDLNRLPLPQYISIDEVYLNISDHSRYAFVIMDFANGQIIDIVHNRWRKTLEDYFYHIPLSERLNVKGVISDGYNHYRDLCDRFFPNAFPVLDSFHVIKYINSKINSYINEVYKRYRDKQRKELERKNLLSNKDYQSMKDSDEMILLRDYRWILLKNKDDIEYSLYRHYHRKLAMFLDTYQIEKMFLGLDKNFPEIRRLKELYISFNSSYFPNDAAVRDRLNYLISLYAQSDLVMFNQFASFLSDFSDNIIRSFTVISVFRKSKKDLSDYYARLSNGPMESFNRKPKDLKRNSRGFSNFDYTRNRILWSTRINPPILAVPKPLSLVHSYHNKDYIPPYKKGRS